MPTRQGFAVNLALLFGAAIPALIATYVLSEHCPALVNGTQAVLIIGLMIRIEPSTQWWQLPSLCQNAIAHPIWALNAIYFVNVNVIFWLISLWQKSTWVCFRLAFDLTRRS